MNTTLILAFVVFVAVGSLVVLFIAKSMVRRYNDFKDRQPHTPQICSTCRFSTDNFGLVCRRYPAEVDVDPYQWCGEYKEGYDNRD